MLGSRVWWIRQGLLVGTAVVVLTLTVRAASAFFAGAVVLALLLTTVGALVAVGGGYVWYQYGAKERMQVIEEQIYGPK